MLQAVQSDGVFSALLAHGLWSECNPDIGFQRKGTFDPKLETRETLPLA